MTDDNTPDVQAAEYVLGLMPVADIAGFETRLVTDAQMRGTVNAWTETFVVLTDPIEPVAPPAAVLAGIKAVLFNDAPASRFSLWGVFSGLVVGGSVAAVLVAVFSTQVPINSPDNDLFAQLASDDSTLALSVVFDPDTGILAVARSGDAAAEGRAFELWLIAGDSAPVSLGLLPEPRDGRIVIPDALRPLMVGGVLAVSDEPEGGSTTGAPTGAVLLAGPIAAI